jgi:GntR family transcriptional regulator, carbon starvation induced regulator
MNREVLSQNGKQTVAENLLPPTRADWIEKQLRTDILHGVYAPGERLLAAELAKHYAVSLTPLREALQRLSTDGLLIMTPQRGVRVTPLSLRTAEEIYELRCLLEPLALRKSMARADQAWHEIVQQTYSSLVEVTSQDRPEVIAIEETNRAFHQALISRCESRWLLNIVTMLSDHCIRYRFLSFTNRGGREGVLEEHQAIFEACMKGDVDTAAQALEYHIRHTLEALIPFLRSAEARGEEE